MTATDQAATRVDPDRVVPTLLPAFGAGPGVRRRPYERHGVEVVTGSAPVWPMLRAARP